MDKDKWDKMWERIWEADTAHDEYEWERKRKKGELPHQQPKNSKDIMNSFIVKHTVIALVILGGLAVLSILFPIVWIAFFVYLFVALK